MIRCLCLLAMLGFLFGCDPVADEWLLFDHLSPERLVSGCGGFGATASEFLPADAELRCADELLLWRYDADTQQFTCINRHLWADCAATITVSLARSGPAAAVLQQTVESGHADCMCFFDAWSAFSIDASVLMLTVVRDGRLVWHGAVPLWRGQGCILIRSDVGWCDCA